MSQNEIIPGEKSPDNSLRVRKTAYIKQQMERQRAAEDARLEYLLREQEIIEELRETIDDSMWQTEDVRKYNQEFQERINMQIYEAHGITGDKLIGMKECKNALYRGAAAVMFLLSLMMTILCGVLYGFWTDICLLMFAYMAMEGALLSGNRKQPLVLELIRKVLYMLIFPAMMGMFVCYELKDKIYEMCLPYAVIFGVFVTVIATLSHFLYDPYRLDRKKIQDARKQIRDIELTTEKEIRKEQKVRKKEEKKAAAESKKKSDTDKTDFDGEGKQKGKLKNIISRIKNREKHQQE